MNNRITLTKEGLAVLRAVTSNLHFSQLRDELTPDGAEFSQPDALFSQHEYDELLMKIRGSKND